MVRLRPTWVAGTGVLAAAAVVLTRRRKAGPRRRERAAALKGDGPLLIAHRGGAALAPENTLAAFRQAVDDWAADMIELDVHASADGHCVVIHDPTVDRTTDGRGAVAGLELAELRRLDAGYRFSPDGGASTPFRGKGIRIPTIDEVLEVLPRTPLVVEVKAAAAQRPLLDAIRRFGASDRVVAAASPRDCRSLFHEHAGPVSASTSQVMGLYLLHRLHVPPLRPPPVDAVQVPETWNGRRIVTPRFVRELKERGLAVHVWTVNDAGDMHRLLDWGVDGILTDRPDLLADILTDRFGRPSAPARSRSAGPNLE